MEAFVTDIRQKPLGSFLGGDYGNSAKCPLCQKPGAEMKRKKHTDWVHVFTLTLNQKNDPVLTETVVCKVPL